MWMCGELKLYQVCFTQLPEENKHEKHQRVQAVAVDRVPTTQGDPLHSNPTRYIVGNGLDASDTTDSTTARMAPCGGSP